MSPMIAKAQRARSDRDRYVAFAFAAADLLIELDRTGRMLNVKGAAHNVFGCDDRELLRQNVLDLVPAEDRPLLRRILASLQSVGRLDPVALHVAQRSGSTPLALVGGCALPTLGDRIFLTITLMPAALAAAAKAMPRDEASGLLDKDALISAALAAPADAKLTLIQFENLSQRLDQLPQPQAQALLAEIGATLRLRSAGGDLAGRLGADAFGLVAGPNGALDDTDAIEREITQAARTAGLVDGLITARFGSIDLAAEGLDEKEAARALAYAVKRFGETRGEEFTLSSLRESLAVEVETTIARFSDFRLLIEEGRFSLAFQPIVGLTDRQVHHYEALCRFENGASPYEQVVFSEEVGLVELLDLAVCRKAIEALSHTTGSKVAVNISGRSIQSTLFREALSALLTPLGSLRPRLIFELTEFECRRQGRRGRRVPALAACG